MKDFEKIASVAQKLGITYHEIERQCGFSGGVISKLMDRKGKLHPSNSKKFQEEFGINSTWWRDGSGEIFKEKPTSARNIESESVEIRHLRELLVERERTVTSNAQLISANAMLINFQAEKIKALEEKIILFQQAATPQ